MVVVKTWLYIQCKSYVLCPISSGVLSVLILQSVVYSPQVLDADHPKHCFHVDKEHVEDFQELSVSRKCS